MFELRILSRKLCSKKLSKYVATFDYIDKILIPFSATSGGVSIISFTSLAGAPVRIASASFDLIFSLTAGIMKKLLSITINKKKKHDKRKLNSIENLVSQALIDIEISYENLLRFLRRKINMRK